MSVNREYDVSIPEVFVRKVRVKASNKEMAINLARAGKGEDVTGALDFQRSMPAEEWTAAATD